jgi:hypothetical protein
MAQPDDHEARITALETQIGDLAKEVRGTKQDAAAARLLAGAADRDVSEFRGEIHDFRQEVRAEIRDFRNEVRAEISGFRAEISGFRAEIGDFRAGTTASMNALREDQIDLREKMNAGFAEMRGKFDAAAAGQQQIVELLNTVIARQGEE